MTRLILALCLTEINKNSARLDTADRTYTGNQKKIIQTSVRLEMDVFYALFICNHGPQPQRREGDSRGKVLCIYFSIVPAVLRKYQGFVLYRQIWQCNENITDCGGKRAVVLPTECPHSEGLLAGICLTNVSPRYSPGLGAVVTNDLCIKRIDKNYFVVSKYTLIGLLEISIFLHNTPS